MSRTGNIGCCLPKGRIKRIHVDKHVILANLKHGRNDPAITIQTSNGSIKARSVSWSGTSKMVQGLKPLSCGARLWVETHGDVVWES